MFDDFGKFKGSSSPVGYHAVYAISIAVEADGLAIISDAEAGLDVTNAVLPDESLYEIEAAFPGTNVRDPNIGTPIIVLGGTTDKTKGKRVAVRITVEDVE